MPGQMTKQWIHRRRIPDGVAILLSGRIEPGVEARLRQSYAHHSNIRRRLGIDREGELHRRHFEFGMRKLNVAHDAERINAATGPTDTINSVSALKSAVDGAF